VAYTLQQAVLRTGLTKSTIQRYFKDPPLKFRQAEVNKDNDKNPEWTLTDDDMEVLWQIKIYQSLGLRRPDVIKILSKTPIERQKELDKAIKSLEQKIEEAKLYSTTRINYFDKKIDSNEIQSIMKEVIKTVKSEYHKIVDLNIYIYQFSEDDDINSDKYILELKELS
jgi:DNA-binding transcriptional MerR regulator